MAIPALQNFIDQVTAVPTVWLNTVDVYLPRESVTTPVIANGATIATAGIVLSKVNPNGGAVTGIILQPGTLTSQRAVVLNANAANSITFAAAGTSNVADGVSDVIAPLTARAFIWNDSTNLWYREA